jgi:hypothetical protein
MRPLPDNCKLFAVPTGMHGTRPWWGASHQMTHGEYTEGWTRRDRWQLYDNGYRIYSSAPHTLDLDSETPEGTSYAEVMEAIDAKWPLPAPPLRAGQVWMLEARQAWTTALLNTTLDQFLRADQSMGVLGRIPGFEQGREAWDKSTARRAWAMEEDQHMPGLKHGSLPGYTLGDQFLTANEAESFLLRAGDPKVHVYLIADPVDPTNVPWTGSMTLGWPK